MKYKIFTMLLVFLLFTQVVSADTFEKIYYFEDVLEDFKSQITQYLIEKIQFLPLSDPSFSYISYPLNTRKLLLIEQMILEFLPFLYAEIVDDGVKYRFKFDSKDYPKLKQVEKQMDNLYQNTLKELYKQRDFRDFINVFMDYVLKVGDCKFKYDTMRLLFDEARYPSIKKELNKNSELIVSIYNALKKIEFDVEHPRFTSFEKFEINNQSIYLKNPGIIIPLFDKKLILSQDAVLSFTSNYENVFVFTRNNKLTFKDVSIVEKDQDYVIRASSTINYSNNCISFNYSLKDLQAALISFWYEYDSSKPLKGIKFFSDDKQYQLIVEYSTVSLKNNDIMDLVKQINKTYDEKIALDNSECMAIHYQLDEDGDKLENSTTLYNFNNFIMKGAFSDESVAFIFNDHYYYYRTDTKIPIKFSLTYQPYNSCTPFNVNSRVTQYIITKKSTPYETIVSQREKESSIILSEPEYNRTYTTKQIDYFLNEENETISSIDLIKQYNLPIRYKSSKCNFSVVEYIQ